jgi:hypothetical protein
MALSQNQFMHIEHLTPDTLTYLEAAPDMTRTITADGV